MALWEKYTPSYRNKKKPEKEIQFKKRIEEEGSLNLLGFNAILKKNSINTTHV